MNDGIVARHRSIDANPNACEHSLVAVDRLLSCECGFHGEDEPGVTVARQCNARFRGHIEGFGAETDYGAERKFGINRVEQRQTCRAVSVQPDLQGDAVPVLNPLWETLDGVDGADFRQSRLSLRDRRYEQRGGHCGHDV